MPKYIDPTFDIGLEVAFMQNSEVFKRLAEVANVASLTPEERYHYEADVKNARDSLNQLRFAFQEGRAEGLIEGEKKGEKKGEQKERLASIKIMLSIGVSPEVIAAQYGMTPEEVIKVAQD